jgi:hypothetical protein
MLSLMNSNFWDSRVKYFSREQEREEMKNLEDDDSKGGKGKFDKNRQ